MTRGSLNVKGWLNDFSLRVRCFFYLKILEKTFCRHKCILSGALYKVYVFCNLFLQGRGALQDIDQMSLFKPLCKYCATVTKVRDIAPTLRKALQVAQSGTPG